MKENSYYFKGHDMDLTSAKNSLLSCPKQRTDELHGESFPTQLGVMLKDTSWYW